MRAFSRNDGAMHRKIHCLSQSRAREQRWNRSYAKMMDRKPCVRLRMMGMDFSFAFFLSMNFAFWLTLSAGWWWWVSIGYGNHVVGGLASSSAAKWAVGPNIRYISTQIDARTGNSCQLSDCFGLVSMVRAIARRRNSQLESFSDCSAGTVSELNNWIMCVLNRRRVPDIMCCPNDYTLCLLCTETAVQ